MRKIKQYYFGLCDCFNSGFSLLEVLLALGIAATILLSASVWIAAITEFRIKQDAAADVEYQGTQAMRVILDEIRNAEGITGPSAGGNAAVLTLDVFDAAKDPTIFDLHPTSGALQIKEGPAPAIALTSSRLAATSLNFQNLTVLGTRGIVRVSFTLTRVNPSGRHEYDYSKTFYGSASLR